MMQSFPSSRRSPGWVAVTIVCTVAAASFARAGEIDFNRDVKPILSNKCFFCHGPDAENRKGGSDGLRLDTAEGAAGDLGGYAAVVPGKPAASALIERITSSDADLLMPPQETGKKLSPAEIEILKTWIAQGAKYAQHWSYTVPQRPAVPQVKDQAWASNDVDRFLLARMEKEGLHPTERADRYALIRRVSLDLTGLPPTLAEVEAFVKDDSPQAYEKLVDRLLAQSAFGEHWARSWLDLARYADSAGYADDPPRTIWMFRDYVIRSLNDNKPFDRFTVEQIAGDLLPDPTPDQLIATAFHRNTLTNNEGGTNDEEFRNVAIVDRVNTTLAVWMGTTINCAQCHTHKYDPITQEEFFRVFAIFNQTEDADRRDESPLYTQLTTEQREQQKGWQDEVVQLEKTLGEPTPELKAAQTQWEAGFAQQLAWQNLQPAEVISAAGAQADIAADGSVHVAGGKANDSYTLEIPPPAGELRALRLATVPRADLPGKGAGYGGGNFVVSRVTAEIVPPDATSTKGRFVRVELPGKGKFLSLAEVQVLRGTENLAPKGKATQSSTDYSGNAERGNDGNTNGDYNVGNSVTHTALSDDPWWEVDLQSEEAIERLVLWNRTDGNVGNRLANFRVSVLNDKRETVWQQEIAESPAPSLALSPSGRRTISFASAFADYEQPGFAAASLLDEAQHKLKTGEKTQGWAVGGQIDLPHQLTLIAAEKVAIPGDARLVVTIEQGSKHTNHTLGSFQLSCTADAAVEQLAKTPNNVLAAIQIPADKRSPQQQATVAKYFLGQVPELAETRQKLAEVQKQLADLKPNTVPIMKELPEGKQRTTFLQHRGNYLDQGAEVTAGVPAAFHPLPADMPVNRLALAKWLVDERNPLTPRVIANRYWEQIFGIGIVSTSEEFGNQGELPVHPELLDWLATELIRLKWDTKAFIKTLVMTSAYQQSSQVTPALLEKDPDNRFLTRGPRFRLSAEMVRDQALSVAGLLSPKMYGPPVKPPQPALGVSAAFGSGIDWATSAGEDKYRRGLYTMWRRSNPYPSMVTFDAPNRETCTLRRDRTNTPLQALVTLNDPVYVEAAEALARRMMTEGGTTAADRATFGFRLVLARAPHPAEVERLVQLFEKTHQRYIADEELAKKFVTPNSQANAAAVQSIPELAAWTMVGNVLLNLDEALMKR